MHLSRLFRYPLKSGADEALDTATVTARGLLGDRRWMVVDDDGEFLTGRRFPQLVRVCARLARGSLQLRAPGQTDCRVSEPRAGGERTAVTVWGDRVAALDAGDSAAAWITALLRIPARLVFMDEAAQRDVDPAFALPGDTVSFADGFPLLLIGSASMADLNRRVGRSMDPRRFRPNLLVDTRRHSPRTGGGASASARSCSTWSRPARAAASRPWTRTAASATPTANRCARWRVSARPATAYCSART